MHLGALPLKGLIFLFPKLLGGGGYKNCWQVGGSKKIPKRIFH
jgi:hypothetical protein